MPKILLVDDQDDLREVLMLALESRPNTEVLQAKSGNEAIRLLSSRNDIDCIICDYRMPDGTGGDVFRYLTSVKSKVPFILCSSESPVDCPEFLLKEPAGHLRKPFGMSALERMMRDVLGPRSEEGYFRIRAKSVLDLGGMHGDLFLKIAEGKYVKLFNLDETFTEDDHRKLQAKKITHLYLRNEDFRTFMDSLIRDYFAIWKLKGSEPETAFRLSTSLHRLGQDLVLQFGLDMRTRAMIREAVEFSIATIATEPKLLEWIGKLQPDSDRENFIGSHSVLLAYLSNALSAVMGWNSEPTLFRLGLAAFLHDITLENEELARCLTLLEAKKNPAFSEKELETYAKHPHLSAELVRGIPGLPTDLDQIIEQHHERAGGNGFPARLVSIKIHPMACVLIVAEDLATRILDGDSRDIAAHLNTMLPLYPDGLFRKMVQAALSSLSHSGAGPT